MPVFSCFEKGDDHTFRRAVFTDVLLNVWLFSLSLLPQLTGPVEPFQRDFLLFSLFRGVFCFRALLCGKSGCSLPEMTLIFDTFNPSASSRQSATDAL